FSVGGVLDLDEGAVPLDQLLKAAREQRRWIQVDDGRWVRLEERLRRGLEQIAEVADPEDGQVSALAAPRLLDAEDQGIELAGPQRWLTLTRRIRIAAKMTPTLPDDLEATLRPYQREGYDWMTRLAQWAPGACLADDMGLGKTVQALALLLRRADQGPQLVVAPTSVSWGWKEEAARFAPGLDVELVRGQSDLDLLEWVGPYGVLVTSYDLVARYIDRWAAISWSTVVWDEAQALKNPSTRRARAARQLNAEFMLALTGTPIENHTGELWSIFRIVLPGLLGGQTAFRRRFQNPIERHNSAAARQALASLVAPFVLRRLKSQVARDLPERTDVRLTIALSDKERRLYDELRRAVLAELEQAEADGTAQERGQGLRFKLLAAITRLRQLACHPKLYNPSSQVSSSKLQALREKVDEMRHEGHQALVFSQFTSLLKLAREALEEDGVRCAWLDGSLRAADRQKAVETFQQGEADVFLLSIKAGGTGLNLTAASYVFLLDPWWNPAVEDQATDRAHRLGLPNPV
ncbi:MAG: DEAD/DEAH box helicase, partial [Myxococcota bacterium]